MHSKILYRRPFLFLTALLPLCVCCEYNEDVEVDDLPGGIEERPNMGTSGSDEDETSEPEAPVPDNTDSVPETPETNSIDSVPDAPAPPDVIPVLTEVPTAVKEWSLPGDYMDIAEGDAETGLFWLITWWPEMLYGFSSYDGSVVIEKELDYMPTGLSYCPVDDMLYLVGADGRLHVIRPADGEEMRQVMLPMSGNKIAMSRKGFGILQYGEGGKWNLLDPTQNDSIYAVRPYSGSRLLHKPVQDLNGNLWGVTDHSQLLCVTDSEDIRLVSTDNIDYSTSIVWSPFENKALVATRGKQSLFDPDRGMEEPFSNYDFNRSLALAFDPVQPAGKHRIWIANAVPYFGSSDNLFIIRDEERVMLEARTPLFYEGLASLPDHRHVLGWTRSLYELSVCFYLFDATQIE